MARAAVEAAAGADARHGVRLQQVVWLRPVVVGPDGLDLHVELFADDEGEIGYEIYSGAVGGEDEERVIHSQGRAVVGSIGDLGDVDVAGLQARCGDRRSFRGGLLCPDCGAGREPWRVVPGCDGRVGWRGRGGARAGSGAA